MIGFMAKNVRLQFAIPHISRTSVNVAKTNPLFGGSQKCCMGVTTRFSYKASNFSCSLAQLAGASQVIFLLNHIQSTLSKWTPILDRHLCKMDA